MKKETKDWLSQAEANLRASKNSLSSRDFFLSVFSAQQSIELCLKAYLIEKKGELVKTHDLLKLGRSADVSEQLFGKIGEVQPSYKETRYPDTGIEIPAERFKENDAQKTIDVGTEVIEWVRKNLS